MANAEYYGITGEKTHLDRARRAYDLYWDLNHGMEDPTGLGAKTIPETRTGRSLGIPMILLNVTGVLSRVDPERKELYDQRASQCVGDILRYHVKPELGCVLENVGPEGQTRLDITEGRIVNPGHDIECAWFLMDRANETGDAALHAEAVKIFDMAFKMGWDKEYGGILYFIDCLGNPPEAYEHDMKLWWPHNEALIASLMIYRDTGKEAYLDHFQTLLDYCKKYFADSEIGEWYGYLRRDGQPTQPACKGSTFKGPFHVMRCLGMLDSMLTQLLQ
jgi:N-acylglucosamine 2-epimerase